MEELDESTYVADNCEYEVEDNQITFINDDGDVNMIYTYKSVSKKKIKITDIEDSDDVDWSSMLPWTFEKV